LFQRAVSGKHGVIAFGSWQKLQCNLKRDAEESFIAGEEAAPIGADRLAAEAAPFHDFTGGEHRLDAEHVIGGHAVLQAMGAAGVEGDVAADGADALA
jgi:hypothetical protein